MYNKTIIHGRLCKDWVKLTNSKNNVFAANTLANKMFSDTEFYDIFIAEKRVENLLKFIPKGSEIIVEGIVNKPKTSLDYNMRIYVDNIIIVRGKSKESKENATESKDNNDQDYIDDDYCPF
nr:MAG TPA: Single strand binding protein [Caudoviricetes sp.]